MRLNLRLLLLPTNSSFWEIQRQAILVVGYHFLPYVDAPFVSIADSVLVCARKVHRKLLCPILCQRQLSLFPFALPHDLVFTNTFNVST